MHKTTIHARCPYLPVWDYYEVTIKTKSFLKCETVEEAADEVRGLELTQEDLAHRLRDLLPGPDSIRVVGRHGANCKLEVTR